MSAADDLSAQAFVRFVDDVRRYIRRRVDDPSAREDLVQEVFLRVHGRREQLEDGERLAGWVRRITANVVTDHYRKQRRAGALPEVLPADEPEVDDGRELLGVWLAANVSALAPHHREVLELTELQGLTQREAAARLGLTLPAVKARVRRGRAELMQRLERCCHLELDHRGALVGYQPRGACAPVCCSSAAERDEQR